MTSAIRSNFETEEHRQRLLQRWETIDLAKIQSENPDKTIVQCFEDMQDELASLQSGLLADMQSETVRRGCLRKDHRARSELDDQDRPVPRPARRPHRICGRWYAVDC